MLLDWARRSCSSCLTSFLVGGSDSRGKGLLADCEEELVLKQAMLPSTTTSQTPGGSTYPMTESLPAAVRVLQLKDEK